MSEDKRQREAFRVAQFGHGHPALTSDPGAQGPACSADPVQYPSDTTRVVLHVDVDCFYAQVSQLCCFARASERTFKGQLIKQSCEVILEPFLPATAGSRIVR